MFFVWTIRSPKYPISGCWYGQSPQIPVNVFLIFSLLDIENYAFAFIIVKRLICYAPHKSHRVDFGKDVRNVTMNMLVQWNLSVTTTSMMKFIICDLLIMCFDGDWRYQFSVLTISAFWSSSRWPLAT